jgi:NAD(P)-dependent dehydrogenase (short-subunit alcohol dehydrogenase family)
MDLGLAGKAVVIVGGSSGMGYATAQTLIAEGARVALIGRDRKRAEVKAQQLCQQGEAIALAADGRVPGSLEAAIDSAADHFGGLAGLAVTAGPGPDYGSFLQFSDADWEQQFQIILMLTVRSCRAAIPHLQRAGGGCVVVTASMSSRVARPTLVPYVAMKGAVATLAKNLALEFGKDGIRVNCVCPGAVLTEVMAAALAKAVTAYGEPADAAFDRYAREHWGMKVALDRVGRVRELADLYVFLLSERAGYTTGATINSDGGTSFF